MRKVVDYVDKAGASSHIFKEIGTSAYTLKTIVSNFNFSSRSTIRSTMRSSSATGADAAGAQTDIEQYAMHNKPMCGATRIF